MESHGSASMPLVSDLFGASSAVSGGSSDGQLQSHFVDVGPQMDDFDWLDAALGNSSLAPMNLLEHKKPVVPDARVAAQHTEISSQVNASLSSEAEAKRQARLARKRASGKKLRDKQKTQVLDAQRQVADLMSQVERLQLENQALELKKSAMASVLTQYDKLVGDDQEPLLDTAEAAVPASEGDVRSALSRILKADGQSGDADVLPVSKFIEVWKRVLFEGSRLLCAADAHNQTALQALPGFVHETQEWYSSWALHTSDADWLQLVSTNMEIGSIVPPSPDHWAHVARALQLTAEQKTGCWYAFQQVIRVVDKAKQEQADADQGLERLVQVIEQQPVPRPDEGHQQKHLHKQCAKVAQRTAEQYQVYLGLKSTWQRRARLASDLADAFCFKQILTPKQTLIAALNAFPFMPDSVSLLSGLVNMLHQEGWKPQVDVHPTH